MNKKPTFLVLLLFSLIFLNSCEAVKDVLGDSAGVDESFNDSSGNHNSDSSSDSDNTTTTPSCITSSSDPDSLSLTTNLKEFYHFDEASGNRSGINGTIDLNETGSVGSDSGVCGLGLNALEISNSDYLTPSTTSPLDFALGDNFSISFWMKVYPSSAGYQFVLGNSGLYFGFYVNGSNQAQLEFYIAGIGPIFNISNAFSPDSSWKHVAMTVDRSTGVNVYLDGTLIYSNATSTFSNPAAITTIGHYNNVGTNTPINGVLDELGIWSKVLTAGEVTKLYNKEYNF